MVSLLMVVQDICLRNTLTLTIAINPEEIILDEFIQILRFQPLITNILQAAVKKLPVFFGSWPAP